MKIGLDIGGSHISIGVINEDYKIILKEEKEIRISESLNPEETLYNNLTEMIENTIKKIDNKVELIGLACPGNIRNGAIICAANLNISNMNLVSALKNKFNIEILLRNDGKCAAIAEKKIGSIRNYDDAIFMVIGTGVGGAVFMDGKMLVPKRNTGFEIGHTVIDINGEICTCGRIGCLETLTSMRKFKNDIRIRLNLSQDVTGKEIRELLEIKENYYLVHNIIDKYIQNLAVGIINLIKIFEPEVISIGGGFTHYKDIFLHKLINEINNNTVFNIENDIPKIVMAELGNDAGIIGAVL